MLRRVKDLYVPRNRLPLRRSVEMRDAMLDVLRKLLADPRLSEGDKLAVLAASVLPLAQVLLGFGTHADVVVAHASDTLESLFLQDCLTETPALAVLFAAD